MPGRRAAAVIAETLIPMSMLPWGLPRQQMTHCLKIAWKCGYLNTVDGLNDVYNSIADYFHPK